MVVKLVNITFHAVGMPIRSIEEGAREYWCPTDRFRWIAEEASRRPGVRLSFDDGYKSDIETALPILNELGLKAAFFIVAGNLGHPHHLTRQDLRTLSRAGMTIGLHGMAHRSWRDLERDQLGAELRGARRILEQTTGQVVDSYACPLGQYNRAVLQQSLQEGCRRFYTCDRDLARPGAWMQPRYSIRSWECRDSVLRVLNGRFGLGERFRRKGKIAIKSRR